MFKYPLFLGFMGLLVGGCGDGDGNRASAVSGPTSFVVTCEDPATSSGISNSVDVDCSTDNSDNSVSNPPAESVTP